jgi:hypothetical protein
VEEQITVGQDQNIMLLLNMNSEFFILFLYESSVHIFEMSEEEVGTEKIDGNL